MEYLYDKVPHIAEIISELHKDKLGVYIEHVIGKLNELVPEIEYLSSLIIALIIFSILISDNIDVPKLTIEIQIYLTLLFSVCFKPQHKTLLFNILPTSSLLYKKYFFSFYQPLLFPFI